MSSDKTSTTAYSVATGLAKLSELPQWKSYFTSDMIFLNRAFMQHAKDTLAKRMIGWLSPELMIRVMDTIYIPGMTEHYLFRKCWIEGHLTDAIINGAQQVIVLGAGLDTLALRAAKKHDAVPFFEIDLPITQNTKIHILQQIGYAVPDNCHFKAADLGKTVLDAVLLPDYHFRPDASTVIILEGVLMYLTEAEVKSLFLDIRRLFTGQLYIFYGAISAPDGKYNAVVRFTSALLRRGTEGTKWHCTGELMSGFMAELGYNIKEWISYKDLQRRYRKEAELGQVPEQDENYYIVTKRAQ